jgi:hypothetical protein
MNLRRLLMAAALLVLAACAAPSAQEIQAEFDAYVEGAKQCTADSECTVASAGCPLGCWAAVRADRKADVEAKARELIKDYERGGEACAYGGCAVPLVISCTSKRCSVEFNPR